MHKKKNYEITVEFKKIQCMALPESLSVVDLAVVWQRGEQINETKGYEMNYIECDYEMDEVFKRVSGFYYDKKSKNENNPWIQKYCIFKLKEYKQSENIDEGRID